MINCKALRDLSSASQEILDIAAKSGSSLEVPNELPLKLPRLLLLQIVDGATLFKGQPYYRVLETVGRYMEDLLQGFF